jgi:hypothetical protein
LQRQGYWVDVPVLPEHLHHPLELERPTVHLVLYGTYYFPKILL